MESSALIERLATGVAKPNATRLAHAITAMIAAHEIAPGQKLPPIRTIADALGMSPSAVGQTWRMLRDIGVIETKTRGGTVAVGPPMSPRPVRFSQLVSAADSVGADLGRPRPDQALLPDLGAAVAHAVMSSPGLNRSDPPAVTAGLREAALSHWPFPADDVMAVHRGIDGLEQALMALVSRGEQVAVEDPTVPRVLDIVDRLGLRGIPVAWHEDGPDLRELARAVRSGARAFIYQPNGHSPTGHRVSQEWLAPAAAALRGGGAFAIELDNFALIHDARRTLGNLLPQATLLIEGFSHSHGPDMQVALLGGPAEAVQQVTQHVAFAHRWVSRVLQDALAWMLVSPAITAQVEHASEEYRRRHTAARAWFLAEGFELPASTSAPSLWIPVTDDGAVAAQLERDGISVLPSRLFERRRAHQRHIHVNGAVDLAVHRAHFESIARAARIVSDEERAARRERDRAIREQATYDI